MPSGHRAAAGGGRGRHGLTRQFLHSRRIAFDHPLADLRIDDGDAPILSAQRDGEALHERGLAGVRESDQSNVRQQLQFEAEDALFPAASVLVFALVWMENPSFDTPLVRALGVLWLAVKLAGRKPAAGDDEASEAGTPLPKPVTLAAYKGKALMLVNVASKCGLTPQ